jgi:hypothetical protein
MIFIEEQNPLSLMVALKSRTHRDSLPSVEVCAKAGDVLFPFVGNILPSGSRAKPVAGLWGEHPFREANWRNNFEDTADF